MGKLAALVGALCLGLMAVAPGNAEARGSGYKYDWKSGNAYSWQSLGSATYLNGYNYSTGSMWNTTIRSNGSMWGLDSRSNYWTYDRSSGSYSNYGTGTYCTGRGSARVCF